MKPEPNESDAPTRLLFHPIPIPHTSSPTHSNDTSPLALTTPFRSSLTCGAVAHNGGFPNVGHGADEPSKSVASK